MKQTKFALLAAVTLAGVTLINVARAQAADVTPGSGIAVSDDNKTPATATTTAEFNVKGGKLTLDAAPDFNFGTKDGIDINTIMHANHEAPITQISSTDLKKHSDDHTKTGSINQSATDTLQVSDYRGVNNHWTLSTTMSQFTSANGGTADGKILLDNAKLGLSDKVIDTNTSNVIMTSADALSLATSGNQEGLFTVARQLDAGSKLELSNLKDIQNGVYDAAITWTLSDNPTTKSVG